MSKSSSPLRAGMIFRQYTLSEPLEKGPIYDRWKILLTAQSPMRELLVFHTSEMPSYRADAILEELQKRFSFRTGDTLAMYETGKFEETGEVYLVRELFQGKPLSQLIQENVMLPEEHAIVPVCRILSLLSAAKQHGLTHSALAADNILIGPLGDIKLAFLGMDPVFRLFDDEYSRYVFRPVALPGIPPERCGALMRTSAAGDIYSLGAILFRLLTGVPPFSGLTRDETIRNILSRHTPDAAQHRKFLSPEITRIVKSMMSVQPEDRPDDYSYLERELRKHACSESKDSVVLRELYQQTFAKSPVSRHAEFRREPAQSMQEGMRPGKNAKWFVLLFLLLLVAGAGIFAVSTILPPSKEEQNAPEPKNSQPAATSPVTPPVPVVPPAPVTPPPAPVVPPRGKTEPSVKSTSVPKPQAKKKTNREKGIRFSNDRTSLLRFPKDYDQDTYVVPEGVETISQEAFANCRNLKELVLPKSLGFIAINAFSGCDSLTSFTVPRENRFYASEDGVLFDREKATLLLYPKMKPDTHYVMPDTVRTLEPRAFSGAVNLSSVTISRNVKEIPEEAFTHCSKLAKVNFTGAVGRIGEKAFRLCPELKSIEIPSSVTAIGNRAFADCGLESIIIRNDKAEIAHNAFLRCPGNSRIVKGF